MVTVAGRKQRILFFLQSDIMLMVSSDELFCVRRNLLVGCTEQKIRCFLGKSSFSAERAGRNIGVWPANSNLVGQMTYFRKESWILVRADSSLNCHVVNEKFNHKDSGLRIFRL